MYSFLICIVALIVGYILYGAVVEKIFRPEIARRTPALAKTDGIDYVPMPAWKVFMIQFLNIAGTGPIFGAIMGAKFGPSCYLWIVFGSIFAGAVHDYFSGMLSVRHDGVSLPGVVGTYLGKGARVGMLVFSMVLLLLVGTVFVYSPALILGDIAPLSHTPKTSIMLWVGIVFAYYIIATLLPIDKLIGKVYPLFAAALLFMAFALGICLLVKWPAIPEIWDGLYNRGPEVGVNGQPIFPCLFITVACGAISGFHATQSPIMARCITSEKYGRPIFYGAMITEGLVALVWAAVSSYFFFDGGMEAVGATSGQAPAVVVSVSKSWLGLVGGILAILGVVAAPITSGDTAFRSARLVISDFIGFDQKKRANRLVIAIPVFCAASLLLWYNIADEDGFNTIWKYFGWANQTLACFILWTATSYLAHRDRKTLQCYHFITLFPAAFMTSVAVTFICTDKIGFHLPATTIPWIGGVVFLGSLFVFNVIRYRRDKRAGLFKESGTRGRT